MGDQTQAYDIFQTPLSSGYPLPLIRELSGGKLKQKGFFYSVGVHDNGSNPPLSLSDVYIHRLQVGKDWRWTKSTTANSFFDIFYQAKQLQGRKPPLECQGRKSCRPSIQPEIRNCSQNCKLNFTVLYHKLSRPVISASIYVATSIQKSAEIVSFSKYKLWQIK
jgi:hypothetical protein